MNTDNMTDDAIAEALRRICAAILKTDDKAEMLQALVDYFLDPLSEDDFFGTEGWEYWAKLD